MTTRAQGAAAASFWLIGEESLLIQCGELLLQAGHRVVGVVTADAAIRRWAAGHAIRIAEPDGDWRLALREAPFDWLLSIANLRVVPREVLALPKRGAVNFHDGPLPRYGGLNAPVWALLAREPQHGVTWHVMTDQPDAGDILVQKLFDIAPGETALTLNAKCYAAGIESFSELLEALGAGTPAQRHALDRATYHRKDARPAAQGALRWDRPVEELEALGRALDFGSYANPLAQPKVAVTGDVFLARSVRAAETAASGAPGTVVGIDAEAIRVAAADGVVALSSLATADGVPLSAADCATRYGLRAGSRLPVLDAAAVGAVDALTAAVVKHEAHWVDRLAALEAPELPYLERTADVPRVESGDQALPAAAAAALKARGSAAGSFLFAVLGGYLSRLTGKRSFDVAWRDGALARAVAEAPGWFAGWVPFRVDLENAPHAEAALAAAAAERATAGRCISFARDVLARYPALHGVPRMLPVALGEVEHLEEAAAAPGASLTIAVAPDGNARWFYDAAQLSAEAVARMQAQLATYVAALAAEWHRPLADAPMLAPDERTLLLETWNATALDVSSGQCAHRLIEAQVQRTPEVAAVVFEDRQLSYRELDQRANRLARHLQQLGVGPDTLVGLCVERSLDMMVGLLGILKAGGAYVPLDPAYPADRIAFMLEDSQARVLLTQQHLLGLLPDGAAHVVCLDSDWPAIAAHDDGPVTSAVAAGNLAYVIYTSGSTGRPKGVMVEHRNVTNFFAGMNERLGGEAPGVWLAVTSLSFDISVLELLWTLTRGFTVVVLAEERAGAALPNAHRGIDFSLFYFSADEKEREHDKYRLLLEGAKFGDRHGFAAVWTPERHFHAFGGLYPNPSVTGAALAAITRRIGIRAGSCVLPLHHPVRVVEEWSVVDNLSHGRVGISFAAGWQPNDFVLRPESYADAKQVMIRDIDTVRRLWRGESITLPGPRGEVEVRTLPRPVQQDLPVWVTTAGSVETYEAAGKLGANVLTHLLGQSVDELAGKITVYRRAWKAAGHPGSGAVSLMLHTFIGDSDAEVKALVRQPLKEYLRTSISLIKGFAQAFPTFKKGETLDFESLGADEMDALLEFSFERYYETSGLFGTLDTAAAMVDRLKGIGVDDVACLIDFGVDSELVLKHLAHLDRLRAMLSRPRATAGDYSAAALIARHRVTHLQCTPSMAGMLLADPRSRDALRALQLLMIGGEAFPVALAGELRRTVPGEILNMYGPTETTIWSATHQVQDDRGTVPIGRPIANTTLYVVDGNLQPVPLGVAGELLIGGAGVVRGYLRRPELTAERFVADPFHRGTGNRLYRTGDLARYRPDGSVVFLGRLDHQVKIRGYRIELGEIETLIARHPEVREAVVVAREDVPGDKRLVAYVVPRQPHQGLEAELREQLKTDLPEFMVPAHVVLLEDLPRTPNRKIDRKALPAPDAGAAPARGPATPPANEMEETIAAIWREVLRVPDVGVKDNFFDLGGHSLLAVQVHSRLKRDVAPSVGITDLFRFPTVRALAAYLSGSDGAAVGAQTGSDRAELRRQAGARRRAPRAN